LVAWLQEDGFELWPKFGFEGLTDLNVNAIYVPSSFFVKRLELIPNMSVTNTQNFFGELSCLLCKIKIFVRNDPSEFLVENPGKYLYIRICVHAVSYYTRDISVLARKWCC